MKVTKLTLTALFAAVFVLAGCSSMSKTGKGALYGGGGGAAVGAGIGAIAGGGKGAAIGSAVGAAVGAGTGALIGKRMDKKQAEIKEQLPDNVEVDQVTDQNGYQAIKVTFADGILFDTGKSELHAESRQALSRFANAVKNEPDTDITIYGHTDNTGSRAVNERLSQERAQAVENYLRSQGVPSARFETVKGLAYDDPIADNSTVSGRQRNRRVEIFITANQDMIARAERGDLD